MATQKEKIARAKLMARQIKSVATRIGCDARDYDVNFLAEYVDELNDIANNFLKLK